MNRLREQIEKDKNSNVSEDALNVEDDTASDTKNDRIEL